MCRGERIRIGLVIVVAAVAVSLAGGSTASATDGEPLIIGRDNLTKEWDCTYEPCGIPTVLYGYVRDGPVFKAHNQDNAPGGLGVVAESDHGTGLVARAHDSAAAVQAVNDATGAGLFASGWWGDGIFATTHSGINKSGVYGENTSGAGYGVVGRTNSNSHPAVWGDNIGGGEGVAGNTTGNFKIAVAGRHTGSNPGFGVWGETVNGQGVVAKSSNGNGAEGVTSGLNQSGVWAHHDGNDSGFGLFAHANVGTGVHGDGSVNGVEGFSQSSIASGVYGQNVSGFGVAGRATGASGTGVMADNTAGGLALKVNGKSNMTGPLILGSTASVAGQAKLNGGVAVSGKASFSRSGVVTVSSSAASVQVTGITLTSNSYVLATLQTHTTGLAIEAAVPNPGASSITIYFNKTAPLGTKVAWFVVN
jgi:hypothetical protein